jgi:hypothetical protein
VATEAKRFERLMVDNNILNEEKKIIGFMKEVSNVDTIRELEGKIIQWR